MSINKRRFQAFVALNLRENQCPSMADDSEPDLHHSPEDNTGHEQKKKCDQWSRNFQPSCTKKHICGSNSVKERCTVKLVWTQAIALRD